MPSLAALWLATVIAGCSAPPPPQAGSQTLRLGIRKTIEGKDVLTPFLYADRLVVVDWQGRPNEGLATGWQWQDDGRTLEVQLRRGVKFHDGTPLTAEVVVRILQDEKANHDRRHSLVYVTKIEPVDEFTLKIRLNRPDTFLVQAIADIWIVDPAKPDVGTGPFKLLTRTPSITATRNAGYYRGTPGIDRIDIITFDTLRAAWVAMMRGKIDMVQEVNRESAEFLEGASRVEVSSTIRPYYIPLVFNVRHPILKRVEVRRALAEAINREEIVEQAMRGHGRVADDPVWPYHWAYNPAGRKYSFNPNAARLRMDAAGLPMHPPSSPGGMASRFSIHCLFWNDPQYERIALLLQRQLSEVGVDLVLEGLEQLELGKRAGSGDFDVYLYQHGSGKSLDWTYRFWHSPTDGPGYQDSGYTGVDAVLERLRMVRPDADVRAAVADLRERFHEDVPAAFIAWPETARAIDATRFDVGASTDPDVFANLWKWRMVERVRASR